METFKGLTDGTRRSSDGVQPQVMHVVGLDDEYMITQDKRIGDLAEVIAGFNPRPDERRKTGKYLLLGGRNIKNGNLVFTPADSFVD